MRRQKKGPPGESTGGPSLGRKRPRRAAIARGATAPQQYATALHKVQGFSNHFRAPRGPRDRNRRFIFLIYFQFVMDRCPVRVQTQPVHNSWSPDFVIGNFSKKPVDSKAVGNIAASRDAEPRVARYT